ncbi:MAG: MBL fold metallo-hydrolase [Polyangiaceae bacterium]|nr:MBL fold metallo-hydrolase [Polyangiaceae bacterium]
MTDAFVRFWGTRGSIPTPGHRTRRYGGNTSCVSLRVGNALYVCDGGTGLRELGVSLMQEQPNDAIEAHLFFSHTHWDHIQGFPFFMPAYSSKNTLYVYDATREERVRQLLLGQMRSDYFPVAFSDLGSTIISRALETGETLIDGVCVRHIEQVHPGRSFAYSFNVAGKKIVYATDSELDLSIQNVSECDANRDRLRQLPAELVKFVQGADLLIADGQYTDEEYATKVGWGHARASTVVDLAVQAGVGQLAIFHHDPMHADEDVDQLLAVARSRVELHGARISVFGAREGLELRI